MKIFKINKSLKLSKKPYITFTLQNGKVIMSGSGRSLDAFRRVHYYDRDYTPNDGASYLNALVKCFAKSTGLAVILEKTDIWYDDNDGTLEDIIKNQTMK